MEKPNPMPDAVINDDMPEPNTNPTIFIGAIEHRHGTNFYAAHSREGIESQIDQYVRDWWENEMDDAPMPESPSERIEQYFEHVEEESYVIEDCELHP